MHYPARVRCRVSKQECLHARSIALLCAFLAYLLSVKRLYYIYILLGITVVLSVRGTVFLCMCMRSTCVCTCTWKAAVIVIVK